MMNINTEPAKLITFNRDGLIEQEHFGYVVRSDRDRIIEKFGEDKNYPFYLRSCAKPLQATLLIDYGLDKEFDMTEEEIAICAASHSGEKVHVDIVKRLLEKFEITDNKLKCGACEPTSRTAREELLLNGKTPTVLHNNCSGKHVMMLGLCKINDWDMEKYDNINHPLQQAIEKKIYELCEIKNEFPVTKDGCGVPIFSMPLGCIVRGYLNVFCNPKYQKIKDAFLKYPYIIGGDNCTDTKIMTESEGLIAKTGVSGLCVVINPAIEEGFAVKICDSDNRARELVTVDLVNNLHWADIKVSHDITTVHNEKIGDIITWL